MHKFLVSFFILATALVQASPVKTALAPDADSPYTSQLHIASTFAMQDFVLDGNLEKDVWRRTQHVRFDTDWTGKRNFPELATEVASLWTEKFVYFAFRCKYSTLNVYEGEDSRKERWGLWERDVVEVFLNPEPARVKHYYEFEVAPNNQWVDLEINLDKHPFNAAAWDSGFEHVTRIDAQRNIWICEMRIPLSALKARLKTGEVWRINFFRADGQGDDASRKFLCWSSVPASKANFHTPTRFGTIRFVR
ncbi:MAG TPA: carbohydrate-binding family 9-like protein [Terriglobales bacterium]|nr:carbohydrate-binding family 9-like protein [Terriglobales bacterium]